MTPGRLKMRGKATAGTNATAVAIYLKEAWRVA
jgi:hypothetical protein